MRTLLLSAALLLPALALAEEATPTATGPEAAPSPTAVASPPPSPAPAPTAEPAAAAPSWTALPDAAPTPAPARRNPRGWDVETAVHSQGVFDGGIHVFSEDSWLTGAELRVRRTVAPGSLVDVAPELSYGVAHTSRLYPSDASTELWLQRYQAGVRASVTLERLRGLRPHLRAGATGLWGTALAHGPYRDHREEAYGWGAYASAGFEVEIFRHLPLLEPHQRALVGLEVGHLYTPGLEFGRMGTLDVNAAFFSANLALRF